MSAAAATTPAAKTGNAHRTIGGVLLTTVSVLAYDATRPQDPFGVAVAFLLVLAAFAGLGGTAWHGAPHRRPVAWIRSVGEGVPAC